MPLVLSMPSFNHHGLRLGTVPDMDEVPLEKDGTTPANRIRALLEAGEAEEALKAGAQLLLLDNMSNEEMRNAVEINNGRALLEASGGINLATVKEVAATGVDLISVGALTHSAQALDISMDISYQV